MIRWVTTDPQVLATWTDKQILAAYSLNRGSPDDDDAKAVAAEMLRRGFPL